MQRSLLRTLAAVLAAAGSSLGAAQADPLETALPALRAVGPEGQGNEAAAAAWRELIALESARLPDLLAAIDGSSDLAANWLRSAVETIADRQLAAGGALPAADLGAFLLDTSHDPRARRLAFDLLHRVDAETAGRMVPGFLGDPAPDLRRDAVQLLIDDASARRESGQQDSAVLLFRQALQGARESDQIRTIAEQLGELGQEVDLPRHFGFLMHWNVIGPFDNTNREGFETAFPPEQGVDLSASYPGKNGEVSWQPLVSTDSYGIVDFNKPLGMLKEVAGYAYTEFTADRDRPAELRLGCKNAWKIWLNGELLFGRDEYHRGARIDQYRLPCQLKAGRNTILVKLCQNEQKEDWTVEWEFQLRVCDATGTAILSTDRLPTPEETRKRAGRSS